MFELPYPKRQRQDQQRSSVLDNALEIRLDLADLGYSSVNGYSIASFRVFEYPLILYTKIEGYSNTI